MSANWPRVKLGEVLTHFQEYIGEPEAKMYPKLSVKLYGKGVTLDAPANGMTLKMKRHQLAKAGQVILSEIWGKKGAIGFVPPEGEGALCTSHFFLFDVVRERLVPGYLALVFKGNLLQEQLDAEAFGSTGYAAVRPKNLLRATIPLPPPEEQRRIVARVDAIADRITAARQLREEIMSDSLGIRGAAMKTLFQGLRDSGTQVARLDSFAEIRSGVTLGRLLAGEIVEFPYLRVANVQDGCFDLRVVKTVKILASESEKWLLKAGDVLVTEGGDWDKLGRGAVWDNQVPNCIHQNHIFCIRVNLDTCLPQFLSAQFSAPDGKAYFQSASKQTTNLASINQRQLRAFPVLLPPLPEQWRIVAHLDTLQGKADALKALQAESAAELDALLPAVLAKAFAGEL